MCQFFQTLFLLLLLLLSITLLPEKGCLLQKYYKTQNWQVQMALNLGNIIHPTHVQIIFLFPPFQGLPWPRSQSLAEPRSPKPVLGHGVGGLWGGRQVLRAGALRMRQGRPVPSSELWRCPTLLAKAELRWVEKRKTSAFLIWRSTYGFPEGLGGENRAF